MTDIREFKLISFAICPFVQRSRILLNIKAIPYEIEYIDLGSKPEWFLDRVPTGKVPALFMGNETLFESAVINEFLDEITPGSVLPDTPLERAKDRAWISLSDGLIMTQFRMMIAPDREGFEKELVSLVTGMLQFSDIAKVRATADGLTLLDAAITPVFMRLFAIPDIVAALSERLGEAPQILAWADRVLAIESVRSSVNSGFADEFLTYFADRGGYAAKAVRTGARVDAL
ncbi:glutathione S-transferase [Jannaschia faecimaris]|uniref:Glutathione S-transferase n=1 Tax=Jannaschia faecimaris TaxID=1244108 RepID=A0A1H3TYE8_9RHOB|nr:glutathione S-transferase family protein [Jannaschia faecimaris]SDZ54801.1 glutathione S-transferase [Jannaschia faecimaris]